jgi:prophage regulatory protein
MSTEKLECFLRMKAVRATTGLGRSTIYLYMSQGRFPLPVPLGTPRAVGWLSSEIDAWMEQQIRSVRGE